MTAAEKAVLAGLSIAGLLLPLVYALTPWLRLADYAWPPVIMVVLGVLGLAFLAAAIWLFRRAHDDLGTCWSPSLELGADQHLVTQCVYSSIRHPMYASQSLWAIAQILLLQNWIAGPGGLLAFLLLCLVHVPKGEQMMLDHFGDQYRAYCARTGRILPRLRHAAG